MLSKPFTATIYLIILLNVIVFLIICQSMQRKIDDSRFKQANNRQGSMFFSHKKSDLPTHQKNEKKKFMFFSHPIYYNWSK